MRCTCSYALALLFAGRSAGLAVQPDEMLADPALEARAREISRDIRCPVCQGETIDDSNARSAATCGSSSANGWWPATATGGDRLYRRPLWRGRAVQAARRRG
jgi:hypothetical protein